MIAEGTLDLISFNPFSPAVVWLELNESTVSYQIDDPRAFEVNGSPHSRHSLLQWLAGIDREGCVIRVVLSGVVDEGTLEKRVVMADKAEFFGG